MIVRNEAHVVREVLDAVAPYIDSWVIVDTGSTDGTQQVIREHLAALGVAGELYERPWRDFGANRSEALRLAQGRADYIWVIDADDMVVGSLDFGGLNADVYLLRCGEGTAMTYWRRQLFRDGMPWDYRGVVHEYATCDEAFVERRLEGEYYVDSRRLGARNLDPRKYERDRDLLLAEVQRDPEDARSVFYLAQSCFDMGDFAEARRWYARRAEMSGWDEETYCAMFRHAESMWRLDEPWPAVQDAYLRAWEFRPTRAEPLHAIAFHYRQQGRYQLGYLFATQAASIPMPEQDGLFVAADVYNWRIRDEQAVCGYWIGARSESFELCRELLARADLPDVDRPRIAANRDLCVPDMLAAPQGTPQDVGSSPTADVTVSLVAGPDRGVTERTLNSFLGCCRDRERIARVLIIGDGLSIADRGLIAGCYPLVDFVDAAATDQLHLRLSHIRNQVMGRFWLHLDQGWSFFAPEPLLTRLSGVLDVEPDVVQVGVNVDDASTLTGVSAAESAARRDPVAGRYVLTDAPSYGPAMFDTGRLDAGAVRTATLDEVLCIKQP